MEKQGTYSQLRTQRARAGLASAWCDKMGKMANRKKTKEQSKPRLGLGDWFQPADPENHVVATARSLFLNVIEERAKALEVLRALRSDVFPLYQRHWPPGGGPLDRVMSPSDFRKLPFTIRHDSFACAAESGALEL